MDKRKEATKFLVPLNGEKIDENTLRLACTLARSEKGKVYAIHVIQVKRALPLDAEIEPETEKAEEVLKRAERIGDEMDCEVLTELLQAREAGPAIVDEAVERGIALIIMAIPYKKPFGEFDLGSIVPYVLKNAPCRVLIWREAAE
ncbi:MAG: universal stress protein [Chloroflexi bacterium]|nr:universal stress protein [Chloroflexota bacterium]